MTAPLPGLPQWMNDDGDGRAAPPDVRSARPMVHLPKRPAWRCAVDAHLWPCEQARNEIGLAHEENELATDEDLIRYMGNAMLVAARDLGLEGNPSRLYRRFLHCLSSDYRPCARCGKPEHGILPGLPPRLFPCDFSKKGGHG